MTGAVDKVALDAAVLSARRAEAIVAVDVAGWDSEPLHEVEGVDDLYVVMESIDDIAHYLEEEHSEGPKNGDLAALHALALLLAAMTEPS